jgi:hypothetical protein
MFAISTLLLILPAAVLSSSTGASASVNQEYEQETTNATFSESTATSEISLSQNPIYHERVVTQAVPLNQTHSQLRMTGNGTLTLPADSQQRNTVSAGTAVVSMFGVASGTETITVLDENAENATLAFREMVKFDTMDGRSKAFIIATLNTNATGLAQLDGMLLVGQAEFQRDGSSLVTLWEWERN